MSDTPVNPERDRVLLDLREVLDEDAERGRTRTLSEYLRLFPEHEEAVAAELLAARGVVPDVSPQDDAGDEESTVGRFRILHELGRGGQAVVYLARDEKSGGDVALKVLHVAGAPAPAVAARFRREARIAARIDHPGICPVLDAGVHAGAPWISMRYIVGCPLSHVIAQDREGAAAAAREDGAPSAEPLTDAERVPARVALIEKAARALHAVHELGIVHRDVKPGNVMVDAAGDPVVVDLGLAHADDAITASLTMTGDLIGTPSYMSPEQLGAGKRVDRRADVYALGATLYECITLRRPFEAPTREALYHKIMTREARPPSELLPHVSRALDTVIATAMNKEPDGRYRTALDFADELRRVRHGDPILARPAGLLRRLRRWARRNRSVAASLALAAAILVGGTATATLFALDARDQAETARRALTEWERLADARRVVELEREAEGSLWPAVPEKASAMRTWLSRANDLLSREEEHRRALEALGESGRAPAAGPFEAAEEQVRREGLADLVAGLERLRGTRHPGDPTVAGMRARLATAESVVGRTVDDLADAWRGVRTRVLEHPRYGSMDLAPQVGLVPLGPDPDSTLEEFYVFESGAPVARDGEGHLAFAVDSAVVLVLIPGGTFVMGASDDPAGLQVDRDVKDGEGPPHEVTLSPYFLSKYELSQGQWLRLTGRNPSRYRPGSSEGSRPVDRTHPVESVSRQTCERVLARAGLTLPTEAQWEYACRAGTTTVWWCGDERESLRGAVNIADAAAARAGVAWPSVKAWPGFDDGFVTHAPVNAFRPNPWGFHSMHGNVYEWCRDTQAFYRKRARPGDGLRGTRRTNSYVSRGGAFSDTAEQCRSARRGFVSGEFRSSQQGVRPSRELRPAAGRR